VDSGVAERNGKSRDRGDGGKKKVKRKRKKGTPRVRNLSLSTKAPSLERSCVEGRETKEAGNPGLEGFLRWGGLEGIKETGKERLASGGGVRTAKLCTLIINPFLHSHGQQEHPDCLQAAVRVPRFPIPISSAAC